MQLPEGAVILKHHGWGWLPIGIYQLGEDLSDGHGGITSRLPWLVGSLEGIVD